MRSKNIACRADCSLVRHGFFGRSAYLADNDRNPRGAPSCLFVSRSQPLGPVRLEHIRRPILERYKHFTRHAQSWELHIDRETRARPLYGADLSHCKGAS